MLIGLGKRQNDSEKGRIERVFAYIDTRARVLLKNKLKNRVHARVACEYVDKPKWADKNEPHNTEKGRMQLGKRHNRKRRG